MSTENFYSDLPEIDSFIEITEAQNFVPVPDDWYILITDIVGSTKAIESGKYKEVNLIGASAIIAILNIAGDIEFPFVFGGDGASILIPPVLLEASQIALLGTQDFAKQEFNMDLRVGIVPVAVVSQANYPVEVAKLKVSDNYRQGIFTGGGLTYATELVKDPATFEIYNIKNMGTFAKANLSGLICPWQDIYSPHEEVVSLLVTATVSDDRESTSIYRGVLEEICKIYGSIENFHPVISQNLKFNLNNDNIYTMAKIQANTKSKLKKFLTFIGMKYTRLLQVWKIKIKIKFFGFKWEEMLRKGTVVNADYKKFDDMLRMVISGDRSQREKLVSYLEKQYRAGKIAFGIHVTDRVLLTCLVPVGCQRHFHFVDGADGGYALAAKEMKAKLNKA